MKTEEKIIHQVVGNSVTSHRVVKEDEEFYYVLPSGFSLIKVRRAKSFDTKKDAMYENFLQRGTPISNYKRSQYYDYYLERATRENPELLV